MAKVFSEGRVFECSGPIALYGDGNAVLPDRGEPVGGTPALLANPGHGCSVPLVHVRPVRTPPQPCCNPDGPNIRREHHI